MTVTVFVTVAVHAGCELEFEAAVKSVLIPTRSQAGFVKSGFYRDIAVRGTFVLYEVWDSEADLQRHLQSAGMSSYLQACETLVRHKAVYLTQNAEQLATAA
ncbi:MAG: antibiotic biosynthesis monooxygenase [Pseudomonadota bacterium]